MSVDLLMLYDGDVDVNGVLVDDSGDEATFGVADDGPPLPDPLTLRKFDTLKLVAFFKSATMAAGGYDWRA